MRYLSVCSGIEAATVAWHPLGWEAAGFAEVEKFPSAVLKHHYPKVRNFGDFTKIEAHDVGAIDLLVGGTPCQSFSVAGLRGGMDDDRGKLALEFLKLADRTRPRWVVWENVPGVLSSNGGRDFGSFLGGLVELGYGFAYRVLDAQYFGVPQRRRRVFVVGHLGDWRRAAAVLFERHSLSGYPPPRRETRERVTRGVEIGPSGGSFTDISPTLDARCKDGFIRNQLGVGAVEWPADIAQTLDTHYGDKMGLEDQHIRGGGQVSLCLTSHYAKGGDPEVDQLIGVSLMKHGGFFDAPVHSLHAEGFDASEDGTGRGTPILPIAIQGAATRENPNSGPDGIGVGTDGVAYTVEARSEVQAVAFNLRGRDGGAMPECDDLASIRAASGGSSRSYVAQMAVRRLTPMECERLQGFPDGYTKITEKTADGPRYRALGNSMAVPCMRFLGDRIQAVEDLGWAVMLATPTER